MGLITKPYTFTAGTTIVSTQVNSDFDTLYSLVNGLLDNANIAGAANIDWAKLATTISRNLSFATTYGIATDFTLANNFIVQFNQVLPAPMGVTARVLRAYNTSFSGGSWAGRTTTNPCYAIVESTIDTLEIYYAPSASAGVAPVWTEKFLYVISTGSLAASGYLQSALGFTPGFSSTGNSTGVVAGGASFTVTVTHNYGRLIIPSLWVSGAGGYIQLSANGINSFTIEVHNTTAVNQTYTYGYAY